MVDKALTFGYMKKVLNFRDFGGYPSKDGRSIKKGLLYRSGELDNANADDLAILQSLGLKTSIDFRSAKEIKKGYSGIPGAEIIFIPLDFDRITRERLKPFLYKRNDGNAIIEAIDSVYNEMVDEVFPQLEELFKVLLTKESYPILINCRGGKDRTGFAVAIIQLVLGVESELIVQDYLKTNELLLSKVNNMVTLTKWLTLGIFPAQNLKVTFTAQERYIRTVMDKITNNYGGIEGYLLKINITETEIEQLKDILLTNS